MNDLPPLTLAYVGDAVYSLYVRERLLQQGYTRPRELHRRTVALVQAEAQVAALRAIEKSLDAAEADVVRRARNAKDLSSAFEALLGFLYLQGNHGRLRQLLEQALSLVESGREHV